MISEGLHAGGQIHTVKDWELYGYVATQIAQARYTPTQIVELILTQVMLKAAIKMWGKRAMAAAKAEMKQ